ncbi:MAG: hypothetical protein L0271_12375 [Gemmatimonadetes bacterium]|nr:hypothetical protein [Gemmatimonadota bacterium]
MKTGSLVSALAIPAMAAMLHAWVPSPAPPVPAEESRAAGARGRLVKICTVAPDPYQIDLVPTANANLASGTVRLRFADSPFGVNVTADGHYAFDATFVTTGVPRDAGAVVAWAASPELDVVHRLGVLREDGTLEARITLNKFLVFLTAEADASAERWSGPILLRGISPSGRMHTMIGHGPFYAEPCAAWGFGPVRGHAPRP